MSAEVSALLAELEPDPFRERAPFDSNLSAASEVLLGASRHDEAATALSNWLAKYQPCLFGRITARLGALNYCFLSESDLEKSDEEIHEKIQAARREWRRKAFAAESSGFVIVAISRKIITAIPNQIVRLLAKRLCFLYLGVDDDDQILLEDVFLRVPGKRDAELQWKAGVNYFCAQGDQRWWQDHRIPGGMALSVNSVGHLTRSFEVGRVFEQAWADLKLEEESWSDFKIGSLGEALIAAMQTINGASNGPSGKATTLLPADPAATAHCPIALPKNLQGKNFCEYFGYYHTDVTLPSEYFRPDVLRPSDIEGHTLDFTYLFRDSLDNPAFAEMGKGIWVRSGRHLPRHQRRSSRAQQLKQLRMIPTEGRISDHPDLQRALSETGSAKKMTSRRKKPSRAKE